MNVLKGEHNSQKVDGQSYLFLDDNFFIITSPGTGELWHLCSQYSKPDNGRRVQGGKCRWCSEVASTTVLTQYALLRSW